MLKNVLNELFLTKYTNIYGSNPKLYNDLINDDELENILKSFIERTIVYKNDYMDNLREIGISFENIILNNKKDNLIFELKSIIENYTKEYLDLMEKHPLTRIFIDAVNEMNSDNYDIKDAERFRKREINIGVRHKDKVLVLIKVVRQNEDAYPTININNIDRFESILNNSINTIKTSDSDYNIFYNSNYYNEEDIIKQIFKYLLLNLTNSDALDIEIFMNNYTEYLKDNTFRNINKPTKMTSIFGDDMYVMQKKSDLAYETPYYLAFMLANKRIELPNVRLGITNNNGIKVANIVATQSSQKTMSQEAQKEYNEIQKYIKENLPSDSYFRFINPTHLVSLVITFGILSGVGINEVVVKDYMPYRYKRIINEKQYSEEEAEKYQTRLTTKNLATYMRIVSNMEGIEILNYPEDGSELKLRISDTVKGKNDFINELFYIGYNFAINELNNKENQHHL